jgi:hypothetical protein
MRRPRSKNPAAKQKNARARDYAAEYKRRIARGRSKGLTRAQARGHPAAGDTYIKRRARSPDARLEQALRTLRETNSINRAAKAAGVSRERFRRFIEEKRLAKRKDGRWRFTDRRPRTVLAITTSGEKEITVAGFNRASRVMQHRAAVHAFLSDQGTSNLSRLQKFHGQSVKDTSRHIHFFETRPSVLLRLNAADGELFKQIYQL